MYVSIVVSDPGAVYWMEIWTFFHIGCEICIFKKTENKREKRLVLAHLKTHLGFNFSVSV